MEAQPGRALPDERAGQGDPIETGAPPATTTGVAAPRPDDGEAARDPAVKAAGGWIGQLARTLKTCRLYDAANPAAVRFRAELGAALSRLLDAHGAITFKFTADDILCDEVSLYPARSRDDNLALPFHRDGIRALTFSPGIAGAEVDALVNAVLLVTGQAQIDDDLVTLLWQAHLEHVDVDYVPAEGDVGAGAAEESGELVPWPTAPAADEPEGAASAEAPAPESGAAEAASAAAGPRSDDWSTGDSTVEVDAGFEELDSLAPQELDRFRSEFAAEHEVSLVTTALAVANAYLDAEANEGDRNELARFIPRMLRHAIGSGSWLEAREALALLRSCGSQEWSVEAFTQELFQPISVTATVQRLDRGDPALVVEFIALARELGETAVDWLALALADSEQRRVRRALSEAVIELVRDNPERLAPMLADPRPHVVRTAVQILGSIGGDPTVGLLVAAARNADPRVQREVVAALARVSPAVARPHLLELLPVADRSLFGSILRPLAVERDAGVACLLAGYLKEPAFEQRPAEEKRAIYAALGTAGTDEILPDLEAELVGGGWPSRLADDHRAAIARCIARIGTAAAREVLERGASSKRGNLRQICAEALRSLHVSR